MAKSEKCLLCKREDPSLDPRNPRENPGTVVCAGNPRVVEEGRGDR